MSYKEEFRSRIGNMKRRKHSVDFMDKTYNSNDFFCSLCNIWLENKIKWDLHKKDEIHANKLKSLQLKPAKIKKQSVEQEKLKEAVEMKLEQIEENSISKGPVLSIDIQPSMPLQLPSNQEKGLPEGFFDNPEMDAKARNVPFVDKFDVLYDEFQKEINEDIKLTDKRLAMIWDEAEILRNEDEINVMTNYIERMYKLRNMVDTATDNHKSLNDTAPHEIIEQSNESDSESDLLGLNWRSKKV